MIGRIIDVTIPLPAGSTGASEGSGSPAPRADNPTRVLAPDRGPGLAPSTDALPLEILMGKARVVSLNAPEEIGRGDLEELDLRDDLRLLVRTRHASSRRGGGFARLSADAAEYLGQIGIKLVGLEHLGRDHDPGGLRTLLEAGVVVVGGLDLAEVEPGDYEMVCLPLRIEGAPASPARVVLRARL
jgi:arylformamidase